MQKRVQLFKTLIKIFFWIVNSCKSESKPKSSKTLALGGQLHNLLAEAEGLRLDCIVIFVLYVRLLYFYVSLGLKESSRSSNPGQSRPAGTGSPLPSPRGTITPTTSSTFPLPSPRGGSKIGSSSRSIRSYEDVALLELHEQEVSISYMISYLLNYVLCFSWSVLCMKASRDAF